MHLNVEIQFMFWFYFYSFVSIGYIQYVVNEAFENKNWILMYIDNDDDDDDGDWLETAIVSFSIRMTHRFKNLKKWMY